MEKTPETKMATRRGSHRESDAEVDAVRPSGDTCPGLLGSGIRRGRWARTGVANTGRAREYAQPNTVAGGTRREGLHGSRRRRRTAGWKMPTPAVAWSRGEGDAGDGCAGRSEENPEFPAQGRTIQATRRRCSKETTKSSNGLMKTTRAGRATTRSRQRGRGCGRRR